MMPAEAQSYFNKYVSLNLNQIESHEERKNLLDSFSADFLLLPQMWIYRIQLEGPNISYETTKKLLKRALFDFYSTQILQSIPTTFKKRFEQEERQFNKVMCYASYKYIEAECLKADSGDENLLPYLLEALSFPHPYLSNIYLLFMEFNGDFFNRKAKKLYTKSMKIYQKINSAKNIHQWFQCVLKSGDCSFIIQNVEACIAQNPMNITLWRLYIEYLEQRDKDVALKVYYRYRRLFLDDSIPSINSLNCLDTYIYTSIHEKYLYSTKQLPGHCNNKNQCIPKFNYTSPILRQNVPFRATFFSYIIKNVTASHLKKLNQTCKFFFLKFGYPICCRLNICDWIQPKYFRQSLSLNDNLTCLKDFNQLWVINSLHVQHSSKPYLLSSIIPKIGVCSVQFMRISNQHFSLSDYEFLTSSGRIWRIILSSVVIKDNDNQIVTFEDIFKNLGQAFHVELLFKFRINSVTFNKLISFGKTKTIKCMHLILSNDSVIFDYYQLLSYLEVVSRCDAKLWISYDEDLTLQNKNHFLHSIDEAFQKWQLTRQTLPLVFRL